MPEWLRCARPSSSPTGGLKCFQGDLLFTEVSLLKGLSAHPNLIAYKQSFLEDGGLLFIIMTLAEDGDLCRVVSEAQVARRALPEPAVPQMSDF